MEFTFNSTHYDTDFKLSYKTLQCQIYELNQEVQHKKLNTFVNFSEN